MQPDSDEYLVRYLLGELPQAEAEQLDERSVTDEAFAFQLRLVEDDLADRYARGEPVGVSLERFERARAASPHLQEKAVFARALQSVAAAPRRVGVPPGSVAGGHRIGWRLAAAAVLLLVTAGYLGLRTQRLHDEIGRLDARRAHAERQNADLLQQLERARATPAPALSPVTATFLLRPPRRGLGGVTVIAVPRGSEQVSLRLVVEAEDYTTFWVAVRNTATNRVVWRSGDLRPEPGGIDRIVTFNVPTISLETQRYSVELSGTSSVSASTEIIGQYPIRVVLE